MKREHTIKSISKTVIMTIAFMTAYLMLAFCGQAKAAEPFKGLLISPASENVQLKNGQIYSGKMSVQNTTDKDMNIKMSVGSYSIDNSNYGSPNYDNPSKYSLMKDWIRLDQESFTLTPGQSQEVNYTVITPDNPPAGMQYATIFAENIPVTDGESSGIVATSRIGMVLSALMTDGKTITKVNIQDEKIAGYQPTSPLKASFAVKNEGNVGADVSYQLKVKSAINGTEVYSSGTENASVYPESTRSFTAKWDKMGVGFYNVELIVKINGRDHSIKKLVCTIPIWIIILVIIAIICLVAYFILNYRMVKEAKQGRGNNSKKTTSKKK